LAGPLPQRQFVHARVFYFGAAVPDKMKREEQVILIVDESRIDLVLHDSGLAANLRAQVHKLHRLARLAFSLIGDPVGLGLPHPRSRKFERSFRVEGVADLGCSMVSALSLKECRTASGCTGTNYL